MSKFESNAVTWFEIPTTDFDRASRFYETLLDVKLQAFPGSEPCSLFPSGDLSDFTRFENLDTSHGGDFGGDAY